MGVLKRKSFQLMPVTNNSSHVNKPYSFDADLTLLTLQSMCDQFTLCQAVSMYFTMDNI